MTRDDCTFFKTPAAFRRWLERHHGRARELWVGFYKKDSGLGGITYQEALDEALCFGWIDGVRKSIDAESFGQRFTPRTKRSIWSAVNIRRVGELKKDGRMHEAGLQVFESRDPRRQQLYAYEQASGAAQFDAPLARQFKANRRAWTFFESQAPWYRRVTTWWVVSAKKPETRQKRLAQLIDDSAAGRRIGQLPASTSKKTHA
jgi:uncharacterized protein YdeI (YjbR/CyaY-like superfamily)